MEKETLIVVYTICDNGITILHISATTSTAGPLIFSETSGEVTIIVTFRSYCGIGNSLELAILCMNLDYFAEMNMDYAWFLFFNKRAFSFLVQCQLFSQRLGGNFPRKIVSGTMSIFSLQLGGNQAWNLTGYRTYLQFQNVFDWIKKN